MRGAPHSVPGGTQPPPGVPAGPTAQAQALWFSIQDKDWSSLVVLPAGPGESALAVARALHEVGSRAGGPIRFLDGRTVTLASSASFILSMTSSVSPSGEPQRRRSVVVLTSVLEKPASVPVALAADAVVLTVALGATSVDAARRTVELVGAEHILGCVTVLH
jgi:hypothetical protein